MTVGWALAAFLTGRIDLDVPGAIAAGTTAHLFFAALCASGVLGPLAGAVLFRRRRRVAAWTLAAAPYLVLALGLAGEQWLAWRR